MPLLVRYFCRVELLLRGDFGLNMLLLIVVLVEPNFGVPIWYFPGVPDAYGFTLRGDKSFY